MPISIPQANNELWPLPADYADLTKDGARQARVNACSMDSTPEEVVAAWSFFRQTYLQPTPQGFFYKRFKESPPGHYQIINDIARYHRCIHAAPRGSAKSTIVTKEFVLKTVLTKPYFEFLNVFSVGRIVTKIFSSYQRQIQYNEHIIRDFGKQKPSKGAGKSWSLDGLLELQNGALIEGCTVEGRKRGSRPDMIILDDPEYDPETPGKQTQLTYQLEHLLFHELLPMFDAEPEDAQGWMQVFEWIGTLIGKRSALHACVHGEDTRFMDYCRRVFSASSLDNNTNQTTYFWPGKMGPRFLAAKRKELGNAAYEAEFENNPLSEQAKLFFLKPDFHTYRITGNEVTYKLLGPGPGPDSVRQLTFPLRDWLADLAVIFLIDLTHTISATSDFAGCLALGIDPAKDWWVLDLYLGRVMGIDLIREVVKLGKLWQPAIIGVESAAGQAIFGQWLEQYIDSLSRNTSEPEGLVWVPRCIYPIRYPARIAKEERISALAPRVERFRIRFPAHMLARYPMSELWKQMSQFTPDGLSLSHDDAADMLSMALYCPSVRAGGAAAAPPKPDAISQLARGHTRDPESGISLGHGLDIASVPWEIIRKLVDKYNDYRYNRIGAGRESALTRKNRTRRRFR